MMKSHTNTTPTTIQTNQDSENKIISQLKEEQDKFFRDYDQAKQSFKPFLVGAFLSKIHAAMEKADNNPKHLIDLLNTIKSIRDDIKSYLTKTHDLLIDAIKQQEEKMLLNLMPKLLDDKISYVELSESIQCIENLLNSIEPQSEAIKSEWNKLNNYLQLRTLRQKINKLMNTVDESFKETDKNDSDFSKIIDPIEKQLHSLLTEAVQLSDKESQKHLNDSLLKIKNKKIEILSMEAKNCMDDIQNNPWQLPEDKTSKYFDLLSHLQTLLPLLKNNNPALIDNKIQYISMLRNGFELTCDQKFIDALSLSAELFYPPNHNSRQILTTYIEKIKNNLGENSKKRKRLEDNNNIEEKDGQQTKEPPLKKKSILKVRFLDNTYSEKTDFLNEKYSDTERSFINILNPFVADGKNLNPKFVAQVLSSLAKVSWTMNKHGVRGRSLIAIQLDLLTDAKDICEHSKGCADGLLNKINDNIISLNSKHQRLSSDYDKFKCTLGQNSEDKHDASSQKLDVRFKEILANFIDELGVYIVNKTEKDKAIQQLRTALLDDLATNNLKDQYIKKMQDNPIKIEDENKIAIAPHAEKQSNASASRTPGMKKVPYLSDAVRGYSPEEFKYYLNMKKKSMTNNNYLTFLIAKNKDGFTALHNSYDCDFDTFSIYINEIKATMTALNKPEEFKPFMTSTTMYRTNFLHQLAFQSKNFDYLKKAAQLFRKEIGDELYAKALNQSNSRGRAPYSPFKVNIISQQVNDYLQSEREKYNSRPNDKIYLVRHSVFNHQNRQNKYNSYGSKNDHTNNSINKQY